MNSGLVARSKIFLYVMFNPLLMLHKLPSFFCRFRFRCNKAHISAFVMNVTNLFLKLNKLMFKFSSKSHVQLTNGHPQSSVQPIPISSLHSECIEPRQWRGSSLCLEEWSFYKLNPITPSSYNLNEVIPLIIDSIYSL